MLARGSNDGVLQWVSPSITRMVGWTPEQVVGCAFIDLVHPLDHPTVRAAQDGLSVGEQRSFEVRLRTCDGTYRWLDIEVHPIVDDGTVTGRLARWHDIHREVRQRQQLDRALGQLRAALDALLDPFIVLVAVRDASGAVVDLMATEANDAACRFLDTTRVGVTSASVRDALGADLATGFINMFATVVASRAPLTRNGLAAGNGGEGPQRFFDIGVTPIDDDHVGLTWRDVSARVEHDRLRAELTSMEALADERDRVARDLHDGAVQQAYATGMLLSALATRVPPERHAEIDRIIDAHDDIVRQIRATILGLTRPDLATTRPSEAVVTAVIEAERGLRAPVELRGHGELDLLADSLLVEHMLLSVREMLSNVARHAVATNVEVRFDVDDHHVTVTVTDDGVGIDAHRQRGYGLSNLAKRATLLGGTFTFRPGPNGGTCAVWCVPRTGPRC